MDEPKIYVVLSKLLLSGRLRHGTKLKEQHLASLFGVSRERIRKVLHRLGHERKLDLVPHRGAFSVDPGFGDARTVYEARRILEGGLIMLVADRMTSEDIDEFARLVDAEEWAAKREAHPEAIRLAGDFHRKLASKAGNLLVEQYLEELIDRTSMLLTFFGSSGGSPCSCREHRLILDALQKRDALAAYHAMVSHLSLIETRLRPRAPSDREDLEVAIRKELKSLQM